MSDRSKRRHSLPQGAGGPQTRRTRVFQTHPCATPGLGPDRHRLVSQPAVGSGRLAGAEFEAVGGRPLADGSRQAAVAVSGGRWPLAVGSWRAALAVVGVLVIALAALGYNGWLQGISQDLGRAMAKSAQPGLSAAVTPTPALHLAKSYIYAGSRLLAVEDAGAVTAPPTDLAVWRPSNGTFYILGGPGSAQTFYGWGTNGDKPVPGDYDGDGKTDFAILRPAGNACSWYIAYSSGSYANFNYGSTGQFANEPADIPVVSDYDGDGRTDVALWRPSTGVWYIQPSGGSSMSYTYGGTGDVPAPADFDGDGRADVAIWRVSDHTFYVKKSSDGGSQIFSFVSIGDKPLPGDYDGDGKADFAVFWDSNNSWYIRQSSNGQTLGPIPYGASTDIFVQNDYDGDGKLDIAVWRPSTGVWWIRQSHDLSTRNETWGMNLDIPVPAYYRR